MESPSTTEVDGRRPIFISNTSIDQLPTPFPLLRLPPEIRKAILECHFSSYRVLIQCRDSACIFSHSSQVLAEEDADEDADTSEFLAITKVSKMIRDEAIAAFLRMAIFDFHFLDQHAAWKPNEQLIAYIGRMKHLFGPPRLLHHLNLTTISWCSTFGEENRWVEDCNAHHIICDMIIDNFDIEDAMTNSTSNEGQYFQGIKNAIAGPKGARLTLCVHVEDREPTFHSWDDSHNRSGVQVWKKKAIIRKRPRTEQGKIKLKNTLMLLGLELNEKDQAMLEPAVPEPIVSASAAANTIAAGGNGSDAAAQDTNGNSQTNSTIGNSNTLLSNTDIDDSVRNSVHQAGTSNTVVVAPVNTANEFTNDETANAWWGMY